MHHFQQSTVELTPTEEVEFEWIDLDPPKDKLGLDLDNCSVVTIVFALV